MHKRKKKFYADDHLYKLTYGGTAFKIYQHYDSLARGQINQHNRVEMQRK